MLYSLIGLDPLSQGIIGDSQIVPGGSLLHDLFRVFRNYVQGLSEAGKSL